MEVILTKDVEALGRAGEVVRVRPGYLRNYLLPRGLAMLATRGNIAELEHRKRSIAEQQAKVRAEHQALAEGVTKASVSVARKVGKDGKLFGSVSTKDIAEALAAQNIVIDRRLIQLPEPLKAVGTFEVTVRFSGETTSTLRVNVVGI